MGAARARQQAGTTGLAVPGMSGHQVVPLTIGADGTWHDGGSQLPGLADAVRILSGCDAVVPVVHGTRMIAPALEIMREGIFDYRDKYGGQADLRVPPPSATPTAPRSKPPPSP